MKRGYIPGSVLLTFLFVVLLLFFIFSDKSVGEQANNSSSWVSHVEEAPKLMLPVLAQSLGRDQSSYHIRQSGQYFKAQTVSQGLQTEFGKRSVTFLRQGQSVTMRLLAEDPVEPANISKNKIEYNRGNIIEWYVNSPLGVEQGFTLLSSPRGKNPEDKVVLRVGLETDNNLKPRLSDDGAAVNFVDRAKESVLMTYSGLFAYDSSGKELSSELRLLDSTIEISVDDTGAQYPIVIDPFIEIQKIAASDAAAPPWQFGGTVSISGTTALVGAVLADGFRGRAYIFEQNQNGFWNETQILTGSGVDVGDFFGNSVHISGDLAIVGASHVGNGGQGEAYIFERDPATNVWNEVALITGSTGAPGDFYGIGSSIDESTSTAMVGANRAFMVEGRAYVYKRDNTDVWNEVQVLTPTGGMPGFEFGFKLALEGDIAAVGAFRGERVYIYNRSSVGTWILFQVLTASDGMPGDSFGVDVDFDGDQMIIGASEFMMQEGKIYFFERDTVTNVWSETQIFTAPDPLAGEFFGSNVTISEDIAVASASLLITTPGRVLAYERDEAGVWKQFQTITSSDGAPGDLFGVEVSLDGTELIVGASGDEDFLGAAYLYGGFFRDIAPIPTLNEWAMIVTALLLGLLGTYTLRKRFLTR